jgi:hypothetical protein
MTLNISCWEYISSSSIVTCSHLLQSQNSIFGHLASCIFCAANKHGAQFLNVSLPTSKVYPAPHPVQKLVVKFVPVA